MPTLALYDYEPKLDTFYDEVIRGLRQPAKTLPCKFFYDERGSQLFDQICDLPEYYPTRTESAIMRTYIDEMTAPLGPDCRLVEYGSGSSLKTRILLDHAPTLGAYIPVDISREHLLKSARSIAAAYRGLTVSPVCADYTQPFSLPLNNDGTRRDIVYFPGSTIGNFPPAQAAQFLRQIAEQCGPRGGLLIGVDLQKAPQILEPAYNDAQGVTAAFNLNLLTRINGELDADFDLDRWEHYAFYNPFQKRIEMHLVSLADQQVRIGNTRICFDRDEMIHTESSCKYSIADFADLAAAAGWNVEHVWMDADKLFSVQYLTASHSGIFLTM